MTLISCVPKRTPSRVERDAGVGQDVFAILKNYNGASYASLPCLVVDSLSIEYQTLSLNWHACSKHVRRFLKLCSLLALLLPYAVAADSLIEEPKQLTHSLPWKGEGVGRKSYCHNI